MSDPERLLFREPRDEVSALESELLRSLEPTVRQKEQLLGSLMAQVTLAASAATATAVLTSQAGAATGIQAAQAAVSGSAASASSAATATLAPAALTAGAASGASTAGGTGLFSGLGLKATVAAFLAVPALGAGTYFTLVDNGQDPAPAKSAVHAPVEPAQKRVEAPSGSVATPSAEPVPQAQVGMDQAVRVKSSPARTPASSLVEEDRLLRQARAKYKAGDHKGALSTLNVLESRYPQGTLVQEREVLRIAILKEQGQKSQADERVKTFREQYPNSPYEAPASSKSP